MLPKSTTIKLNSKQKMVIIIMRNKKMAMFKVTRMGTITKRMEKAVNLVKPLTCKDLTEKKMKISQWVQMKRKSNKKQFERN